MGGMGKRIHVLSNIDSETRMADCANCGPVKVISAGGGRYRCPVAKRQHKGSRGRRAHGLNSEAAARFVMEHGNRCDICRTQEGPIYVDHCHETGRIRGTLCRKCNLGIAYFRDDPEVVSAAARYLT